MKWLYNKQTKILVNLDTGTVIREEAVDNYSVNLYLNHGDDLEHPPIVLCEFGVQQSAYDFIQELVSFVGALEI